MNKHIIDTLQVNKCKKCKLHSLDCNGVYCPYCGIKQNSFNYCLLNNNAIDKLNELENIKDLINQKLKFVKKRECDMDGGIDHFYLGQVKLCEEILEWLKDE